MPPVTSRLPSQRRVHIRLLAERFARAQLWAVARMRGHRDGVPAVLFIDTHDSGRARMAKALFITRAGSGGLAGGHDVPDPDAARHVVWDVRTPGSAPGRSCAASGTSWPPSSTTWPPGWASPSPTDGSPPAEAASPLFGHGRLPDR